MIILNRLQGGKKFAVTMSYDDGSENDRPLIELFNKYGIRGTFHVNSGNFHHPKKIQPEEFETLYKNHEISCHGERHRTMQVLPSVNVVQEILADRQNLETITGRIIRGMSYANGSYDDNVINALSACGIVYARTVKHTNRFGFPENFMEWHPTCHHRECLDMAEKFIALTERKYFSRPALLYVWGHSFEFVTEEDWKMIETFCQMVSGREDIWYATNIEIYEYITAQRQLVISADNKMVYNPTALEIWFTDDNAEEYSIKPGETLRLG